MVSEDSDGDKTLEDVAAHLHEASAHLSSSLVGLLCGRGDLAKQHPRILISEFSGTDRAPRAFRPPSQEFYGRVSEMTSVECSGRVMEVLK